MVRLQRKTREQIGRFASQAGWLMLVPLVPVTAAHASGIILQPQASPEQVAVLAASGADLSISKSYVAGSVGVDTGGLLTNKSNSEITGNAYETATGQYTGNGKLDGSLIVDYSSQNHALARSIANAQTLVDQIAALSPTVTYSNGIAAATNFTGNGHLNVLDVIGDITNSLLLTGTVNDTFIVRLTGTLSLSGTETLDIAGGATASHVVYYLSGVAGTVATSTGNVINGTLLGLNYRYGITGGTVNGEVIGGGGPGGGISISNGARVYAHQFAGMTDEYLPAPEPAPIALIGGGLTLVAAGTWTRRRHGRHS